MNPTTDPTLHHVACLDPTGLHRMAYRVHGDPANPRVVVCVHGLTRQGRDFDVLAQALAGRARVVCPDVVGRGDSDWLRDAAGYQLATYAADMVTLLARLDVEQVDWVGTSMGGLIGMLLASLRTADGRSLVRRLVLNDVGPALHAGAIARIGSYLGKGGPFANLDEGAAYLQTISAGFGPHTEDAWRTLSAPQFKPTDDGRLRLHYDPELAAPFRAATPAMAVAGEAILWQRYDAITCPTLLIRGAESDLLTAATAQAMTKRGPRPRLVELPGVGHAPTLLAPEQVALVRDFLFEAPEPGTAGAGSHPARGEGGP